jgi:multiple sugar transport system permease protein
MAQAATPRPEKMSRWRRSFHRQGLWYVLPAIALFAGMVAYPLGRAFYLSFFDYSVLEPDSSKFVGLANYAKLFTSHPNRGPFWNTLYFTVLFVPPYVILSLLVALMLHRVRRGSVVLRTMIFVPVVVSMAVSSVMFTLFYNPTFGMGQKILEFCCDAINWLVGVFGHTPIAAAPPSGMLGDPGWAMIAIVILCLWNGIGINVILYLVGLQRIPEQLHEAAVVDGATGAQRFWHVTLPQLRPTIYLVMLLSMVESFKVFGQPFIMTAGGPQDATLTYVMRLYKLAFQYGKFELGYASAMAYALALFIFAFTLCMRRFNKPTD